MKDWYNVPQSLQSSSESIWDVPDDGNSHSCTYKVMSRKVCSVLRPYGNIPLWCLRTSSSLILWRPTSIQDQVSQNWNSNKIILLVLKGSDNGVLHSGLLRFWTCSIISTNDRDQLFLTGSLQQMSLHLSARVGSHPVFHTLYHFWIWDNGQRPGTQQSWNYIEEGEVSDSRILIHGCHSI
jgi:hypothetical protein